MVEEPVFEPVVLRIEADEDSGRLTVASDDDLTARGHAQVAGQVVLHFGEADFTESAASHARRATLALRASGRSRGPGLPGRRCHRTLGSLRRGDGIGA